MKYTLRAILFFLVFLLVSCRKKPETVSKAQWIRQAYASLESGTFPRIRAVSWWNEKFDDSDLRINSSQQALAAYREAVAADYFLSSPHFLNDRLQSPTTGIYHAANPGFGSTEDSVEANIIQRFEQLAGKPVAWAYFSDNWYDSIRFPARQTAIIHQAGSVPFIRMMPRSEFEEYEADTLYSMQHIIDGRFDAALLQWFAEAAALDYPLLVEFGTEMNGDWFPWNGLYNGGGDTQHYGDPQIPDGPERFRDAFRHIVMLSRQAGATNITWFFHLDAEAEPDTGWNRFENYFPGDDYVDWVGVSVYGPMTPGEENVSFADKLQTVYERMCRMTRHPLAVLETGVTELP